MRKLSLLLFSLLTFIAILFFGFSSNSYAATTYNPSITMKVTNTNENKQQDWYLNVRAKASTNAKVLGILREGDTIEVVKTGAKWAQISKSSSVRDANTNKYKKLTQSGYCSLEYLKQIGMPEYYKYTTISKAKVHSKTSSSSTTLKTLPADTTVKVVGSTKAWYKLSTGGYCLKKYFGKTMVISGTDELHMRVGPGTEYKADHTEKAPKVLAVVSVTKNGWAKLGNGFYCSMDYLFCDEYQIESEIINENSFFTTTLVNRRSGPGTSFSVLGTIDALTKLEVIHILPGGWYQLKDGGYVQCDNVANIIQQIDVYLANYSTTEGKIVLKCNNGQEIAYNCCGGQKAKEYQTPTGNFTVLWKEYECSSSKYPSSDGKPNMNRALFFQADGGYAIHCGDPNGLSHGCIHVEDSVQEKIYELVKEGTPINISQDKY